MKAAIQCPACVEETEVGSGSLSLLIAQVCRGNLLMGMGTICIGQAKGLDVKDQAV